MADDKTFNFRLNPAEQRQLEFIRKMLSKDKPREATTADAIRYAITATFENES
jgi:hypothetical protein